MVCSLCGSTVKPRQKGFAVFVMPLPTLRKSALRYYFFAAAWIYFLLVCCKKRSSSILCATCCTVGAWLIILLRWRSASHFCCYAVCCCLYFIFWLSCEDLWKNKIPSAAPQTVWRRGGAFRWQLVSVTLISVGMRKIQNSFLNSHEKLSEAAAAAKQFFNQRNIPAALACSKKTNDRFSF